MMNRFLAGVAIVALAVPVVAQNPIRGEYGFGPAGTNDAAASIRYTESSGDPRLEFRFTTSDTLVATIDATSGLDLQSNALTAGNLTASSVVFEGATADDSETTLSVADPTADLTYRLRDDGSDTYEVLAMPDADVTAGHFTWPPTGASDSVTTTTDETMLCQRLFLPQYITVANVYLRGVVGSDSASDDTISFAIYEDADAGVQLTEGVGADLTTTANVTLDVTDVTLGPGMYRFCGCAQDVSGAAFHAAALDDESIDVMNLGAVTFGTAANVCVAGDPPATTGALTTADDNQIVFKIGG